MDALKVPAKVVDYFLNQWWIGGTAERWAEFNISRYPKFGISTTSSVEGSHSALKGALSSSSGSLSTAGQKLNHRNRQRLEQLGVVNSNENIIVRYNIRTQIETSMLCSAISRSALELIHAEVMKKVHGQEEPGTMDKCNCATRIRYLLPCSHQIRLGVPIQVTDVHPRWRIHGALPTLTIPSQNLDPSAIAGLKDPAVLVRRKGRPRGTRRLPTSAEIVQRAVDEVGHTRRTCPAPDNRSTGHMGDGQSVFDVSLSITNDGSIQLGQHKSVINTGEEDESQGNDETDGSTLDEMWTDILCT
ncbi:hypothetical protein V1522DRAFT_438106 [Lipomyces starkeyi]